MAQCVKRWKYRRSGVLLLCALLCMMAVCGLAEPFAFGGRGEDAIYEAVAAESGFFAAGTTASNDGDLQARTRAGETGWALRVGGDGQHMWSFCSGKSGMVMMAAPHAYADGRFSVVLTDDTRQRGEWIVLDSRGRQESRVTIPALSALCPLGETGRILRMQPTYGSTGPYLLLVLVHEGSGALCCAALFPDGGVRTCGEFYGDEQGVLLPLDSGGAVYIGAELGAMAATRLTPGAPPATRLISLAEEDVGVTSVTCALADGDDSLLIAMQTVTASQQSGARILRVSASGDTLFERQVDGGALAMLTGTDTGYAALLDGSRIIFFDEDGALQGQAVAPEEAMLLLPAGEGVYALTHDPERGRRQAVFTRVAMQETAEPVWAQEQADEPAAPPDTEPAHTAGTPLALNDGYLRCEGVPGGVIVTLVDGLGGDIWQTRIPIHTAADRLVFESAQMGTDGELLLHGYYETDLPEGMLRERTQVRLSAEGVLKEIGTAQ